MTEIVGIETRLRQLMDDHETLLGYSVADETQQGYYVLVVRSWPHPEAHVEADILAERYAYMTKGDGSDGWISGDAVAINRRAGDAADMAAGIAQLYAGVAARLRNGGDGLDPVTSDLRTE